MTTRRSFRQMISAIGVLILIEAAAYAANVRADACLQAIEDCDFQRALQIAERGRSAQGCDELALLGMFAKEAITPSPEEAKVRQALERKVSLDFVDKPIADVTKFLADAARAWIVYDQLYLPFIRHSEVTLKLTDVPLSEALAKLLKPERLDYVIKDGAIFISSAEEIRKTKSQCLALSAESRPLDGPLLAKSVYKGYSFRYCSRDFILCSNEDQQVIVIKASLPDWSGPSVAKARSQYEAADGLSKSTEQTIGLLRKKVSFGFDGTPFEDVILYFEKTIGLKLVLSAAPTGPTPDVTLTVTDMECFNALSWLAGQLDAQWFLKDNAIHFAKPNRIAPEDRTDLATATVEVRGCGGLVASRFSGYILRQASTGIFYTFCSDKGGRELTLKGIVEYDEQATGADAGPDGPPPPPGALAAATASNAFAFDLYGRLKGGGGNLFFSPLCVSAALTTLYGGARGNTAIEMAKVLHFDKAKPAFSDFHAILGNRRQDPKQRGRFRITLANSLWLQQGFQPEQEFLRLAQGTQLQTADFHAPAETAEVINAWVAEQTADRIKDIVSPDDIGPGLVLVVANTIYFLADWLMPFETHNTRPGKFHLQEGRLTEAQFMRQSDRFRYFEDDLWQVVELPYVRRASMLVFLPKKMDGIGEVERRFSPELVKEFGKRSNDREVNLTLPRFTFGFREDLTQALTALGMGSAFGGEADFSGISRAGRISIGLVRHQSFVNVDELGTEAAAATISLGTWASGDEDPPVNFVADHPFLFLIIDDATAAILFIGRLMNPQSLKE